VRSFHAYRYWDQSWNYSKYDGFQRFTFISKTDMGVPITDISFKSALRFLQHQWSSAISFKERNLRAPERFCIGNPHLSSVKQLSTQKLAGVLACENIPLSGDNKNQLISQSKEGEGTTRKGQCILKDSWERAFTNTHKKFNGDKLTPMFFLTSFPKK